MTSDASHPPTERESPDASGSAVADRTATDVFASLAADGPSVDTDAILGGTSPEEIIDRTDEPAPSSSVHSSLIDEGELTELILPDRRDEDSFLWVETTESPSQPDDDGDTSSFETFLATDHDGTEPPRTTAPDSPSAMTDSTETRTADGSESPTTDGAPGFGTDGPSSGGKVPTQTTSPRKRREPRGAETEPEPPQSDPCVAETSPTVDQSLTDAGASGTSSADAAVGKSEIRTTVQYFDHRKPDRSPDGLLASAKARLSRLFRPGRSG